MRIQVLFALLLCCFLSPSKALLGQNLVPDSSFESVVDTICGITQNASQFNSAFNFWNCPSNGEPDVYSTLVSQSCWNHAPGGMNMGPIPVKGKQEPRTGNFHIGLGMFTISGLGQREYVQTELVQALVPGNQYAVSFYVSLADDIEYATSSVGAYFSETILSAGGSSGPLPYVPQVEASQFLTDTLGWMRVSDTVAATGPWRWVVLGNFRDDASTPLILNPGANFGPGQYGSYYYLDDLSVVDLGPAVGLEKPFGEGSASVRGLLDRSWGVLLAPVYAGEGVSVSFEVYDLSGKLIARSEGPDAHWDAGGAGSGLYFWRLRWQDGRGHGRLDQGKVLLR